MEFKLGEVTYQREDKAITEVAKKATHSSFFTYFSLINAVFRHYDIAIFWNNSKETLLPFNHALSAQL